MIQVGLTSRGKGDKKFTIETEDLTAGGILSKRTKLKDGDFLRLKLVAINGAVVTEEFKVTRNGASLYAQDVLNPYLFGSPTLKVKTVVGCCECAKVGGSSSSSRATARVESTQPSRTVRTSSSTSGRTFHDQPTKTAIKNALRECGTKSGAADFFGVSPRTFGRWCDSAGL